jgi:hypothetical protein
MKGHRHSAAVIVLIPLMTAAAKGTQVKPVSHESGYDLAGSNIAKVRIV